VPSWSSLGIRPASPLAVDASAVTGAGRAEPYSHLLFYPQTGTFLRASPSGRVYRISNGVARYVPSWGPYGGAKPTVRVAQLAVDRAGTGGPYNHLRRA